MRQHSDGTTYRAPDRQRGIVEGGQRSGGLSTADVLDLLERPARGAIYAGRDLSFCKKYSMDGVKRFTRMSFVYAADNSRPDNPRAVRRGRSATKWSTRSQRTSGIIFQKKRAGLLGFAQCYDNNKGSRNRIRPGWFDNLRRKRERRNNQDAQDHLVPQTINEAGPAESSETTSTALSASATEEHDERTRKGQTAGLRASTRCRHLGAPQACDVRRANLEVAATARATDI